MIDAVFSAYEQDRAAFYDAERLAVTAKVMYAWAFETQRPT
jgi:hypothetical protein